MGARVGGAGIALIAVVGIVLALNMTPAIPADAGSSVLASAAPTGSGSAASRCLERLTRPSGWLDLCWTAYRTPDADPGKDYYVLRVTGTLSGDGTGVRWSLVRAELVGQPADRVFDAWPDGLYEGPCRTVDVGLTAGIQGPAPEIICGRTEGAKTPGGWGQVVTWQCVGCLIGDRSARSVALYEMAAVEEGEVPGWTIAAEFGE